MTECLPFLRLLLLAQHQRKVWPLRIRQLRQQQLHQGGQVRHPYQIILDQVYLCHAVDQAA
jgi:hypothetical protein